MNKKAGRIIGPPFYFLFGGYWIARLVNNQNMVKQIYILDGANFLSFQEFTQYFSDVVFKESRWCGNLDALNDMLRGGFGTPENGFILRWENSVLSRQHLGYSETIQWLEEHIATCDPTNTPYLEQRLADAKQGRGETLFDTIVEIIQVHGPGGTEAEDSIDLLLL